MITVAELRRVYSEGLAANVGIEPVPRSQGARVGVDGWHRRMLDNMLANSPARQDYPNAAAPRGSVDPFAVMRSPARSANAEPSSVPFMARLCDVQAAKRRGAGRAAKDPVAVKRKLGQIRRYSRRTIDRD